MSASRLSRRRWLALFLAAALVPLGLMSKGYHGPAAAWVHSSAGDMLYAAFWLLLLKAAAPRLPTFSAALWVVGFCTAVELTQLSHAPWLDALRGTQPGRLLLGAVFSIEDIAYYMLGAGLAAAGLRALEVALPLCDTPCSSPSRS